jgi:hypothetical protein
MTTPPTTATPKQQIGVIAAIDANATAAINVGRRLQELSDEIRRIGARGRAPSPGLEGQPPNPGRPATGEINRLLGQIVDAHAAGAREGKRGDVSKLEAQIVELQQRVDGLLLEHQGVRREGDRVKAEYAEILRTRHDELVGLLRAEAANGQEQLALLASVAADTAAHRQKVNALLQLAVRGLADGDDRRALVASLAPWAVPRDQDGRVATRYAPLEAWWEAVSKTSGPPLAPPQ